MSGALDPVAKIMAGVIGGSAAGPAGRAVGGDGRQSEARRVATWGVVASVAPLRVTLPTADGPAEMTPVTLVNPADLDVGAKVRLEYVGRVLTITGRQWGGASDLTAWQDLPLAGEWVRYSSSFGAPRWCARGGIVYLSGVVGGSPAGGQDAPIATLPAGARPSTNRIVAAIEEGVPVDVQITPAGDVWLRSDAGPVTWLSLDGMTFAL